MVGVSDPTVPIGYILSGHYCTNVVSMVRNIPFTYPKISGKMETNTGRDG